VTSTQDITVNVNDVNDAPVATAASYYLNLLPQDQSGRNITLTGTDEDGDTLTYTLVNTGSYGTASLSGTTVTYQTSASTQSAQSESFTFKVNDGTVDSSDATISLDLRTDPLYQYQWHLNNTGQTNFATNAGTAGADLNVDTAIVSGITGNGIVVAVVDDGLEIAHEDLADNIVSGSYDFVNSDSDPTLPDPCEDDDDCGGHGTSVAGIIAAEGWNNKGVRGVAPNASLIGYNVIATGASASFGQFWGTSPPVSVDVDVYNNSFGVSYAEDETTYDLQTYLSGTTLAVLENGVNNLRSGKGAIYVYSAGNNFSTHATSSCGTNLACQEGIVDNKKNQPYTIPVASLNADGVKASYSTPGANIWISGFGGEDGWDGSIFSGNDGYPAIMTVDRSTCSLGYSRTGGNSNYGKNKFNLAGQSFSDQLNLNPDCNYNSHFNGTSAAAPTVSGVVALMLEANPNLTWRDVKHILATTADKIDASKSFDQQGLNQYSWIENQAGYEHHKWYGFGKIDAAEAVSTAKTYTANSRGTFSTVSAQGVPNSAINDDGTTLTNSVTVTKTEGSNNFVEYVKVHVKFNHAVPKSIGIRLQSPDGTVYPIMQPYTNISTDSSGTQFDIGIAGFYGESVEGNWTIALNDYIGDSNSGTFVGWNIYVSGN
jgi:subtilisin family serine protease